MHSIDVATEGVAWSVYVDVCVLDTIVSPAKTAKLQVSRFEMWVRVGCEPKEPRRWGPYPAMGKGIFAWVSDPFINIVECRIFGGWTQS